MRNTATENVAEHSLTTAMFAHALGVINKTLFDGDLDPDRLAAIALFHEAGEVLTGDLPTPVKYADEMIRTAYKNLEEDAENRLVGMLPPELSAVYEPLVRQTVSDRERLFVKAADRLAALVKCKEEQRGGNREFSRAAASTEKALQEMKLPEAAYFCKTFLPAFDLSLDELEG